MKKKSLLKDIVFGALKEGYNHPGLPPANQPNQFPWTDGTGHTHFWNIRKTNCWDRASLNPSWAKRCSPNVTYHDAHYNPITQVPQVGDYIDWFGSTQVGYPMCRGNQIPPYQGLPQGRHNYFEITFVQGHNPGTGGTPMTKAYVGNPCPDQLSDLPIHYECVTPGNPCVAIQPSVTDPAYPGPWLAQDEPTCLANSGCAINGCTDPNAQNYNPAATVDDGSCLYPGCTSGAFPSFQFSTTNPTGNACDPNANYHTWAGGYTTSGNSFTWYGGTITDPFSSNVYDNGDLIPDVLINLVNANQSSYCEWCDDFAQGGGTSSQFMDWLPIWHSPQQTQPWLSTPIPTPPEAHCCCCPGQGGGPFNPTMTLSVAPPFDDTGIDPIDIDKDRKPKLDKCCAWCATVDPNIPSKPPAGCQDFDCNNCPRFKKPKPTFVIPENLKKVLQRRAGIKKQL